MPDIRDFATACPDKSYREQVMEEIRQEAESYGMTVEAYAAMDMSRQKRRQITLGKEAEFWPCKRYLPS